VMLSSGTLFIEVSRLGSYVVDVRTIGWEYRELPGAPQMDGQAILQTIDHHLVIDVLVAFPGVDIEAGAVRIGTDAMYLAARFRNARLTASLAASSLWVVILASSAIVLGLRRPRPSMLTEVSSQYEAEAPEAEPAQPLTIDSRSKCVTYHNHRVTLSPKPFLLFELLAQEQGRVYNDSEIIEHVWTDSPYVNSNDVRQCVYRLRCHLNKIEKGLGDCITNVKGFGYRFDMHGLRDGE
jgi:DNA-binding response OmpR family regulator